MKQPPTFDGSRVYRCLLIGLDEKSARECTEALRPLAAIVVPGVREACEKMSAVLPLVVVIAEGTPGARDPELAELAGACGADLIMVDLPLDRASFSRQILDSIQKGESRRIAR